MIDARFFVQCDGGWRVWRRMVGFVVDVEVVEVWRAEGCQQEQASGAEG